MDRQEYNNKAALSWETLIVIVLAMLVLVVSIVWFQTTVDDARETSRSCSNLGGECKEQCVAGEIQNNLGSCEDGFVCCGTL